MISFHSIDLGTYGLSRIMNQNYDTSIEKRWKNLASLNSMHIFIFEYPLVVFIARCLAISMDPMQKLYIESVAYDICSTLIAVWIWNEHFVIRCCTYCTQLEIHVQIHLRPIEINDVLVVFMSAHNVNYKCKRNTQKKTER